MANAVPKTELCCPAVRFGIPNKNVLETAEITVKYEGYLKKEQENIDSIMSHIVSEDAFQKRNNEKLDRVWKLFKIGYNYQEHDELRNSWLKQWDENPEYNCYKANEIELFAKGNMLFLIPHADRKPIKVIIA